MGIFSDRCQALIDPVTRRALSGEALEDARKNKKSLRCKNAVRKNAKFCNKCGTPAPGGWVKCPSCGKWVGNESRFCWKCDTPLYPDDRGAIAGGVWHKTPELFAQRFEAGDIRSLLKKDLQVQAGTLALLLDGGKLKGTLSSGVHNPESLARAINHWGTPPPRSVVLVDSGDVALPVMIDDLRSSEQIPVNFYGEIIVRFNEKGALPFLENFLKENRDLSYSDIAAKLAGELRHTVDALCVASTMEDLVRDPARRLRLENAMDEYLKTFCERNGLTLVHVSSAEFSGREYDALVEQEGELELKRRELEFQQRMRETLAKEEMDTFKSEADLQEYVALIAHERGVSDALRDQEMATMRRAYANDEERKQAEHTMTMERDRTAHEIGINVQWVDYENDRAEKKARTAATVRKTAFEQEAAETDQALEWREKKNREKARHRKELADIRKGMDTSALLADLDDPDQRADLLKLVELEMKKGLSPEQILAHAAEESDAAANALAKMADQSREGLMDLMKKQEELYRDAQDRHERTLKTYMEPAVEAAKRADTGTTVNKMGD